MAPSGGAAVSDRAALLTDFHRQWSEEERRAFSSVRLRDDNQIEVLFKRPDARMTVSGESCVLEGGITPERLEMLAHAAADRGFREVELKGHGTDLSKVRTAALNFGLSEPSAPYDAAVYKACVRDVEKFQPLEKFMIRAKEFRIHDGSYASGKSAAEKFLKSFAGKPGKIAECLRRTKVFIHRNKTVFNLSGMGAAFVLAGPIGTTLYSQADKARRAHEEAVRRRRENKRRMTRVAEFMEKGIQPPKETARKKGLYASRPYIRFAGHLAVRLAGTALLTAACGPFIGVTFSGMVTAGKSVWNTKIIQESLLKAVGRKPKNPQPLNEKIFQFTQTAIGVELQPEKIDRFINMVTKTALFRRKSEKI